MLKRCCGCFMDVVGVPRNLPIFDAKDYDDLGIKMDTILGFQEFYEVVKIWISRTSQECRRIAKGCFQGGQEVGL